MLERLLHLIEKYPLNLISHLCSSLPIIIGLVRFRYLSKGLFFLLVLFSLYFISDSYSLWLAIARKSTFPIQNLQPLFEIWLISVIYLRCFQERNVSVYIKFATLICSVIIIISFREDTISTIGLTTQRLFTTSFVLFYFNKILTDARVKHVLIHSMFWISAGLLIYSAGTFFFSLFSSYLYSDNITDDEFDPFWKLNQILFIIFCLFSGTGLWFSKYDKENFI